MRQLYVLYKAETKSCLELGSGNWPNLFQGKFKLFQIGNIKELSSTIRTRVYYGDSRISKQVCVDIAEFIIEWAEGQEVEIKSLDEELSSIVNMSIPVPPIFLSKNSNESA